MSSPRLSFLYPYFLRPISKPAAVNRYCAPGSQKAHHRGIQTTIRCRQETFAQRYGPATDPQDLPLSSKELKESTDFKKVRTRTKPAQQAKADQVKHASNSREQGQPDGNPSLEGTDTAKQKATQSTILDAEESHPQEETTSHLRVGNDKPLETVLHMEPPSSRSSSASEEEDHNNRPPHLHAPPYVHHFDTFSLVKDLEKGSLTSDQAITLMKAVRSLLAVNLDVAREGLVSKSDVENETYLFRAACSELRTEVQNSRQSTWQKMRTERAHLQHEVDILGQKLTQESLTLKDDLRGMFNDRKMAVRMEQRGMESAIQELNYKITVALNSDSKGEVEGLRWVLTRRAAMAIAGMALLILGSLRYSSYMIHLQDEERKAMAAGSGSGRGPSIEGGLGTAGSGRGRDYTVPAREMGTQTGDSDAMLASMDKGSSPSYVSLG
ncbi:hypothetical protein MMC09_005572 [Bachmanniomyces sp. S44760]|nr:hypothetical protein [Bachmanniomyces sp. S44760]